VAISIADKVGVAVAATTYPTGTLLVAMNLLLTRILGNELRLHIIIYRLGFAINKSFVMNLL
jgi:hypothetical protein